jgi:RNA-directed DNA polymerase
MINAMRSRASKSFLNSAVAAGQVAFDFENAQAGVQPPPFASQSQVALFDCKVRYEQLMSVPALISTFWTKFSNSAGKGIDRVNGFQFGKNRIDDLVQASRKCLDGTFRFTPYLEVLRPKGRDSKPRLISIPTVRDRVILHQLKDLLAGAFPDCVPKSVAGSIVREIVADLPKFDLDTTYVAGCDVKKFYDTLHRDRLMRHLGDRITESRALNLIWHSICTPTVPVSTRRRDYASNTSDEGVPQGLATSNILAAIYVSEIDDAMSAFPVRYYRYVDDVLIYGAHTDVVKAQKSFIDRARRRGLSVHKVGGGKSHLTKLRDEFRYLGYVFKGRTVSVRPGSVENLLRSLAAKFSDFRHNRSRRLERYKYLTPERLNEIFLLELNERITGAIRDNRRYGWVAYFSQITDHSLLHKLDSVVRGMFGRLVEFDHIPPSNLKSFARAFFEMKFRPEGGYVRNFNLYTTVIERMRFLVERGRVGLEESLTDDQIDDRFERYLNGVLRVMQADEARIY